MKSLSEKESVGKTLGFREKWYKESDVIEAVQKAQIDIDELMIQLGYRKSAIALKEGIKEIFKECFGKELTEEEQEE